MEDASMEYMKIAKADIQKLLTAAGKDFSVYAPVKAPEGLKYRLFDGKDEIVLEYQNTLLSPKEIFFPQTETICEFDYDTIENIPLPEDNILVFGVRPCDALSLTYLDKNFSAANKGYDDPYYVKRREGSLIISLACGDPCDTCFCTSVEGSPAGEAGADILAFDLDGEYLLKTVTEAGKAFAEAHGNLLRDADDGSIKAAAAQAEKAAAGMEKLDFSKDTLKAVMDAGFNDRDWQRLTQNCIGCGACTYLCPTCYCFDISDEQRQYKGKRIRTWDSCQYGKFTMHASGHNPRTDKTQRLRQRFMHKFSYTVETTGDIFCVGCGRCIVHCPVNLDIREVVRNFANK